MPVIALTVNNIHNACVAIGAAKQAGRRHGGPAEVAIVGGGIFGVSTALELAERGRRVVLIERGAIPAATAASRGPSRKIRARYAEPRYSALARLARRRWLDLERRSGVELVVPVGNLLYSVRDDPSAYERMVETMTAAGLSHRRLDAGAMAREFPQLGGATRGILEQEAGYLRASRAVRALAGLARSAGARLVTHTNVEAVEARAGRFRLQTSRGVVEAGQVVVAAGGWTPRLVPDLRPQLRLSRQGIAYVGRVPPAYRRPAFIPFGSIDDGYYGFPAEGRFGLKVAYHDLGESIDDPDFDRGSVSDAFVERVAVFVTDVLRLDPARHPIRYESCLYNLSPSGDLLLDAHPEIPGLVVATAGSGHGFKFGSVIGSLVADRLDGVANDAWWPNLGYAAIRTAEAAGRPL